jgi:hypothetical protein
MTTVVLLVGARNWPVFLRYGNRGALYVVYVIGCHQNIYIILSKQV